MRMGLMKNAACLYKNGRICCTNSALFEQPWPGRPIMYGHKNWTSGYTGRRQMHLPRNHKLSEVAFGDNHGTLEPRGTGSAQAGIIASRMTSTYEHCRQSCQWFRPPVEFVGLSHALLNVSTSGHVEETAAVSPTTQALATSSTAFVPHYVAALARRIEVRP